MSPYGAVPATIVPHPGAVADVHVLLLEDRAPLDATEPNYVREALDGLRLEVDRVGPLRRVEAYVSRWGPLLVEGRPVPLGSVSQSRLLESLARRRPGAE